MYIDTNRGVATAAFLALLALSVFWPAPVIAVNDVCCHAILSVDNLSFLGREAPSWDVAFWCLAGLVLIAIVQSAPLAWRELWQETLEHMKASRPRIRAANLVTIVTAALVTEAIWRWVDQPVTALAERLQTAAWDEPVRLANRFGGGMKPAMIVLFYLIAGGGDQPRRWIGD